MIDLHPCVLVWVVVFAGHYPLFPCSYRIRDILVPVLGYGQLCPPASELYQRKSCDVFDRLEGCDSSSTCVNGITDPEESDVDCGGESGCGGCQTGMTCGSSSDCSDGLSCSLSGACVGEFDHGTAVACGLNYRHGVFAVPTSMLLSASAVRLRAAIGLHGVRSDQLTTSILSETVSSTVWSFLASAVGLLIDRSDVAVMRVTQAANALPLDPCEVKR